MVLASRGNDRSTLSQPRIQKIRNGAEGADLLLLPLLQLPRDAPRRIAVSVHHSHQLAKPALPPQLLHMPGVVEADPPHPTTTSGRASPVASVIA